ncbi:CGNR zinc finger domain-containing protein [Amycolatopsis sp. NPDC051903]|uniref:CGNR zinc finger domain-containing protein n=1 Tax=Amycolatopsis sp. NPDC051903 TaxID=3363936 RepID=UPI003794EDC0
MNSRVSLEDMHRAGFPMGGEPLVALDLADTLAAETTPGDGELLASPERGAAWWGLQLPSLPPSPAPGLVPTLRLRTAIRDLLEAHLDGRTPDSASVDEVNAAAASVPTSPRLGSGATALDAHTRWHTEHGGNVALAAVAREAIELFGDSERLSRLRRCANPDCTMLFLATNRRRRWCAGSVCGNRVRVARHYRRTHVPSAEQEER